MQVCIIILKFVGNGRFLFTFEKNLNNFKNIQTTKNDFVATCTFHIRLLNLIYKNNHANSNRINY